MIASNRIVFITGEITQESMLDAKKQMMQFCVEESKAPIFVVIDSSGGDQIQAISFIDIINMAFRNYQIETHTIAFGECMSAGFLIFLAGHQRWCLESSVFMMHESSISVESTETKSLSKYINISNKVRDKVIIEMLKKTKIKPKDFFEKIRDEWWFDAKEAKKYQIVNGIL